MDVETRHQEFSSEAALGGIMITDRPAAFRQPNFIGMDPPKHSNQWRCHWPLPLADEHAEHGGGDPGTRRRGVRAVSKRCDDGRHASHVVHGAPPRRFYHRAHRLFQAEGYGIRGIRGLLGDRG